MVSQGKGQGKRREKLDDKEKEEMLFGMMLINNVNLKNSKYLILNSFYR